MSVNSSRSQNRSLREGATDGRYRKARPDTEIGSVIGDQAVRTARADLHPSMNYGFVNDEIPLEGRAVPGF